MINVSCALFKKKNKKKIKYYWDIADVILITQIDKFDNWCNKPEILESFL